MALFDRDTHDSTSSRFHNIAANDGVVSPVGALHQHVGLQVRNDVVRSVLVEDRDGVHALERRKNLGTLMFGRDGTVRAFDAVNRSIRVDGDDEDIPERTCLLQIADVSRMQEIEYTVSEDHTMPGFPSMCGEQTRVGAG